MDAVVGIFQCYYPRCLCNEKVHVIWQRIKILTILLKNSIVHTSILVQNHTSEQTFLNFLIFGKYRFPPKKFYYIDCSSRFVIYDRKRS